MNILVDLVIVAIILLFTFIGYKRGLIGVAFKIFSFVIAILIAFILFKPVSNYIVGHTTIDEKIQSSVEQMIIGKNDSIDTQKVENTPNVISNYINSAVEKATNDAKTNIAQSVSHDITVNIINAAVILILFIIAKIGLFFVKALSNAISNLPILKQFNELRWYYIWNFRRTCYYICNTSYYFIFCTNCTITNCHYYIFLRKYIV